MARSLAGRGLWAAGTTVLGLLFAIGLTGAVVALLGGDPGRALAAIHRGSLASPDSLTESLLKANPLILTGLAVAAAFRSGIFNIGAEGQLLVGMLGAAVTALLLPPLPGPVAVSLALVAGTAAGMLWALVPALLKLKRGVPEVISTIMLNFVAVYLIEYLVRGPLKDPQSSTDWSRLLPDSTHLPRLRALWNVRTLGGGAIHGPGGSALVALGVDAGRLHLGVLLAAMVVPLAWLLLTRSTMGFQTRALGLGADAARATGIPTVRATLLAFLTSGGLAGLGGAIELLGVVQRMYLYAPGSPGYGFGGIAVALLGQLHPLGISLAAFFFGALSAGCSQMQRTAGVSMHVAALVQAAMVLLLISLPSASSLTRTWVRLSRLRAPR